MSFPYKIFLGILPSFICRTCPSQRSLRWRSIMNIVGSPHLNTTSVFSVLLVHDIPIKFLRKCIIYMKKIYEKPIILRSWVTWFFHTPVPRPTRVEAALLIRLSICLSTDSLLLILDSKYVNSSTTSTSDDKAIHQTMKVWWVACCYCCIVCKQQGVFYFRLCFQVLKSGLKKLAVGLCMHVNTYFLIH